MENTKIQWATSTFNPWIGCAEVSPGCDNCYAKTLMDIRYGKAKWGPGELRVETSADYWKKPLAWNRKAAGLNVVDRPQVFPSLCDVFDAEVPMSLKDRFWRLIEDTTNLHWLLLTKRASRMLLEITERYGDHPPLNAWLGVSVENQAWANRRLESFRDVPCRGYKWVSYEPTIGPVDWDGWDFMDWLIVGGESGHGARRFESAWARQALDYCREKGIAYFMKQKGANSDIACQDAKGGNPEEWPEWCRIRQMPWSPRLLPR